jgi:hypothetical protein
VPRRGDYIVVGRRLGKARRRVGMAVTAAGAVLVIVAAWGIAGSGDVGYQLASAFTALPGGLLLLMAGSDLLTRSTCRSRSSRPVVSVHEWLATAQSRGHAAKAALN